MQLFRDILYPGTYNPIHNGHLDIAEKARIETGAQNIVLIPAFSPYHKSKSDNATAVDRLEMTRLAASERKGFEVSDVEFRMGKEKSYTFETVKQLIEETLKKPFRDGMKIPQKIKLMIGADSLETLENWHKADALSKLVHFVVVSRANYSDVDETARKITLPGFSFKKIDGGPLDISSTKVRESVQKGVDISKLVPKTVLDFIQKNRLYK